MFWTKPGGDFAAGASAIVNIGDEALYTWASTPALVADVQQWLDQPAGNFGWIVIADESDSKNAKRFDSRENIGGVRPALTVDYTPAVPVGACCTGTSCQLVTATQCALLGGTFGGVGTSCSPNPCFDPPGACCASNGSCTDTTQSLCEASGAYSSSRAAAVPC